MFFVVWERLAAPWAIVPLLLLSLVLVATLAFVAFARNLRPELLVGEWPAGEAEPTRRIVPREILRAITELGPMFGLLGTVVGLIVAFESTGMGASGEIGRGLATQLYTTGFGIALAVPSFLAERAIGWEYQR